MCYHIIIINLPHTLNQSIDFCCLLFRCWINQTDEKKIQTKQTINSINKLFPNERFGCRTVEFWLRTVRSSKHKSTVPIKSRGGWPMPKCENILIKWSTPYRSYHRKWKYPETCSENSKYFHFCFLWFFQSPIKFSSAAKHILPERVKCKRTDCLNF